ncbi:MAG: phosphotransferase [Rothia sp. (in: high G+C Gram-positive bacteria)]|nr:phosphotransferase [Rothia sp. (in: high G+C Gram-positive bacteria)]
MSPYRSHLEQAKYLMVVQAVMDQAGLNVAQDRWDIRTSGSAHIVINMGSELSIRVAKTPEIGKMVARRTEILRRLPHNLPFEVPRPITRTITRNGYTAVGLSWIKGEPRHPGPAPAKAMAQLVRTIHTIDYDGMEPYLDAPHQHWGGLDWVQTLQELVVPKLLRSNRKVAAALIDAVLDLEPVRPSLIHSDLAGHNILWNGDKLVGVIDWDHATIADPAYDFAALGNWYGWASLKKAISAEEQKRAIILSRLLALEAVAYSITNGKSAAIVRLAIERADNWLTEHKNEFYTA